MLASTRSARANARDSRTDDGLREHARAPTRAAARRGDPCSRRQAGARRGSARNVRAARRRRCRALDPTSAPAAGTATTSGRRAACGAARTRRRRRRSCGRDARIRSGRRDRRRPGIRDPRRLASCLTPSSRSRGRREHRRCVAVEVVGCGLDRGLVCRDLAAWHAEQQRRRCAPARAPPGGPSARRRPRPCPAGR